MHHIWAEPDWPNFRWDGSRLLQGLMELRARQACLAGRISAPGSGLAQEALLEMLVEDVVQSSAIESEFLNPQRVRGSIARKLGMDQGALQEISHYHSAIEGIVDVVMGATLHAREPLTEERLFGWHSALFPGGHNSLQKIDVGRWRSHPVYIGNGALDPRREKIFYTAPPPERVPQEMRRFLDWFNAETGEDPLLKAGLAHYWFVAIHPFDDGNGRIGRAIMDMALARSDPDGKRFYSVSASIKAEVKAYYAALEETSNGTLEVTAWLEFFLDRVGGAIDLAEASVERAIFRARFRERHRSSGLSPRQQKAINRLLDGFEGKMTSRKWAKIVKVSEDMAAQDILDLIGKGVLQESPGGGRTRSYELILPAAPDAEGGEG